jgi:hypothetical protein
MAHYKLCCKHWKRNYGRVYIFRVEIIQNKYIKNYKLGTCMVMQKKKWITFYLFKEFLSFFIRLVPSGIS